MLDSHPRIGCPAELKLIPEWMEKWKQDRRNFASLLSTHLGVSPDVIDDAYRAKVMVLLERFRAHTKKARIAEKTPNNVFFFAHLHALFPESPMIHLIRDGRDVVASLLSVPWVDPDGKPTPYTQSVERAAKYWVAGVTAGLRARSRLGDRILDVRYEELVQDTEAVMRRVLAHVAEPWDARVLHHSEAAHQPAGETSAEQVNRPVYTSSIGRWKDTLTPEDLSTVERVAGAVLAQLGYR
jgi:hypothetical protein